MLIRHLDELALIILSVMVCILLTEIIFSDN